jgi:hypothetical protein
MKQQIVIKILILVYLLSITFSILSQQSFYADGAGVFLANLQQEEFYVEKYTARKYARYVMSYPFLCVKNALGITDYNILSYIYGIGLYLPIILGMIICYYILRNTNIKLIIFPIIGLFGITQNIAFFMCQETIVITSIYWPILLLIVLKNELKVINGLVLIMLSLLFMRCHESSIFFGICLNIILIHKANCNWINVSKLTRIIWVIVFTIISISILIAVQSVYSPYSPNNKASFIATIPYIKGHCQAIISMIYIGAIAICVFLNKIANSRYFKGLYVILIFSSLIFSLIPFLMPLLLQPQLHYQCRSFPSYMLPILTLIAYPVMISRVHISDSDWSRITNLTVFLVVVQLTWHILATAQWYGFRKVFQNELAAHNGLVKYEDTKLANVILGNQLIMTWGWTNPSLSILWSKNQEIKTIITNPASRARKYEPFNPAKRETWPVIEKYGFSYKLFPHQ